MSVEKLKFKTGLKTITSQGLEILNVKTRSEVFYGFASPSHARTV